MAVVKNLIVRAGADFSAISKQAKKVSASMRGMGASVKGSCSAMTAAARKVNKAFSLIGVGLSVAGITAFSKSAKEAYDTQAEGEAKLAQVMRNTIGASAAEIQSIKDLTAAQQALGVIGDEVQLAGAQELATYVTMTSTLKTLLPVLNDMTAQQYGLGATMENSTNIATMLGKVLSGQTSGLSRYGYYFTEAQEAILKFGSEAQRAATLAEVVEQSVGGMNAALAATPSGRLKQVSNTLGDIKENFGQAVTTIGTVFLPGLNAACSLLANVATLANKVAQAVANVFGGAAKSTATVVSYTTGAASAMDDLTESTQKAGAAAKKSLGSFSFDTLQKLSGGSGGGSGSSGGEEAGGSAGSGLITETAGESGEAAESIGWLEKALARIKKTADSLNFNNLNNSLKRLKEAAAPLGKTLFSGLKWGYDHVLEPLARWTVEGALPAFLDMLAGACDLLGAAVTALKPAGTWLWENFLQPAASWSGGVIVSVMKEIGDGLSDIAAVIRGEMSVLDFIRQLSPMQTVLLGIASALAALKAATAGIAFATTIGKIVKQLKGLDLLNVPGMIGKISQVFTIAGSSAYTFSDAVRMVFGPGSVIAGIAGVIGGAVLAITNFISMLKNGFSWANEALMALGVAITAVGAIVLGAPALVAGVVAGIVAAVATAAVVIHDHWEEVKSFFINAWTKIKETWSAAGTWFDSSVVEPVKNAWSIGMETVKKWGSDAWTGVQTCWKAAGSWFSSTVAEPVKNAWSAGMETVKKWGSDAWTGVKSAWSSASGWFRSNVTEPISNGFKGLANTVIGFFEGFANGGIRGVNGIIDALNRIHINVPDWVPGFGGRSWGFNLPSVSTVRLPRLASGAVFEGNDPYLAVVNDQKHGVNVESPLSTIVEAMMIALRDSNFGGDIHVDVRAIFEGQLAALARYMRPYFEAEASRVGPRASKGGV